MATGASPPFQKNVAMRQRASGRERRPQASRVPGPSQEQWTPDGPSPKKLPLMLQIQTQKQRLRREQAAQGSARNSGVKASRKPPAHPLLPRGSGTPLPQRTAVLAGRQPPSHPVTGMLGLGPVRGLAHVRPQFPQLFLPGPRMHTISSSLLHLEPTHEGQRP